MANNDPSKIRELEKFLPFMTSDEKDVYFLCSIDRIQIPFTHEQYEKWESMIDERNGVIQDRFDKAVKK